MQDKDDKKRRFPPPWTAVRRDEDCFVVRDANGIDLAFIRCRDDLQKWSIGWNHLDSEEARKIAVAISRIPEFMMQWKNFAATPSKDYRWKKNKPYHVALEGTYVQGHWDEINALCRYNNIPFDPTGQRIDTGVSWIVYEFAIQVHAIMFWDHFNGRWLRYGDFFYPDRPDDIPKMRLPPMWDKRPRKPGRG